MNTTQKIHALWESLRDAIDATHKAGNTPALRGYARDISFSDDMEKLLTAETANERRHRRTEVSPRGFSARTAAMLLLCSQAESGANRDAMPPATDFLEYRRTAVEARVIGWLVRERLDAGWCKQVKSLDYAKLMAVKP